MRHSLDQALVVAGLLLALASPLAAADATAVDYPRDVKPLLHRCHACHGALRQQGGLRVDTVPLMREGGDSGSALTPGNPDDSLLWLALKGEGASLMPPEGAAARLTDEEISVVRRWIEQGAVAPEEPTPHDPRGHWAFQPPQTTVPPEVEDAAWRANPIDAFVAAEHQRLGLSPVEPAEPRVLLRRLYLDLIGLPPTPEETEAFLADSSPQAYADTVDRLLDSPRYGERWGRHWMDVWRYSDWAGYRQEIRESQYHIWRWRDWIIESLNGDKPYDQMVVEMLAADEIAPDDNDALRATGYLGRNWYKFNRHVWLDNAIEHMGKAFLGLTINCARCHEHKYDPIEQEEYYRIRALLEPYDVRYDPVPGETDPLKSGLARIYDKNLEAKTFRFDRGNDKRPDKDPVTRALPEMFGAELSIEPVSLPVESYYPALRSYAVHDARQALQAKLDTTAKTSQPAGVLEARRRAAVAELAAFEARLAAERAKYGLDQAVDGAALAQAAAVAERAAAVATAEAAVQDAEQALATARQANKDVPAAEKKLADAQAQRTQAAAAADKKDSQYTPLGPVYPNASTGRRLALARWIVDRENPLAARVAVNHIWLRHFGSPLVPTVFDLGNNGQPPTHPKLLDWLAIYLMDHQWSMKTLHRLIVTSRVYQLSSTGGPSESNEQIDADNRYLWRANTRRLEAEVVRDCVLYAGGSLDLTMGGPELPPEHGQTTPRRSVYFRHAKEKRMTFLRLFDGPGETECYRRDETIVPQQALALANSPLAKDQSRRSAQVLSQSHPDDSSFVAAAFDRVLCRPPSPDEIDACVEFLQATQRLLSDPTRLTAADVGDKAAIEGSSDPVPRARENLVLVLLNHNDFVTVR